MNILLIRNNSILDVMRTRSAPNTIRRKFPDAHIMIPVGMDSDTLVALQSDIAIDEILYFPHKGLYSQLSFLRKQTPDITIGCFGGAEISYKRHLAAFLSAPGPKYVMDCDGKIVNLFSFHGIYTVLRMAGMRDRLPALRKRRALCNRTLNVVFKRNSVHQCSMPQAFGKILYVRLDALGDFVMTLPAMRALKSAFPGSQIDVLVRPGVGELATIIPEIDHVFTYDAFPLNRGDRSARPLKDWISVVKDLRLQRYDLGIDAWGMDTARLFLYGSGTKTRVGPERSAEEETNPYPSLACLLTNPVNIRSLSDHRSIQHIEMLQRAGLNVADAQPYRLTDQGDTGFNRSLPQGLSIKSPYAIIHGASRDVARMWPPERFAAVADYLIERHNLNVVITGAASDLEDNQSILGLMKHRDRAHDATGLLSMADLPALFFGARIMVTVDTGPMHIADICGTPLVALFLPMNAGVHYPYGQPEAVVLPDLTPEEAQNGVGNDVYLMGRITLKSVLEKIEAVVADTASRFVEENPASPELEAVPLVPTYNSETNE